MTLNRVSSYLLLFLISPNRSSPLPRPLPPWMREGPSAHLRSSLPRHVPSHRLVAFFSDCCRLGAPLQSGIVWTFILPNLTLCVRFDMVWMYATLMEGDSLHLPGMAFASVSPHALPPLGIMYAWVRAGGARSCTHPRVNFVRTPVLLRFLTSSSRTEPASV